MVNEFNLFRPEVDHLWGMLGCIQGQPTNACKAFGDGKVQVNIFQYNINPKSLYHPVFFVIVIMAVLAQITVIRFSFLRGQKFISMRGGALER